MKEYHQVTLGAVSRIQEYAADKIISGLRQVKNYPSLVLKDYLDTNLVEVMTMLNKLEADPKENVWISIATNFNLVFVLLVMFESINFKEDEIDKLITKFANEKILLNNYFQAQLPVPVLEKVMEPIVYFEECLSQSLENVVESLVKLAVKLKDQFSESFVVGS